MLHRVKCIRVKRFNFDTTLDSAVSDIIQWLFVSENHTICLDFTTMYAWKILFLIVSQRLVTEHPNVKFEWDGQEKSIRLTTDFSEIEENKCEMMIDRLNSIIKNM